MLNPTRTEIQERMHNIASSPEEAIEAMPRACHYLTDDRIINELLPLLGNFSLEEDLSEAAGRALKKILAKASDYLKQQAFKTITRFITADAMGASSTGIELFKISVEGLSGESSKLELFDFINSLSRSQLPFRHLALCKILPIVYKKPGLFGSSSVDCLDLFLTHCENKCLLVRISCCSQLKKMLELCVCEKDILAASKLLKAFINFSFDEEETVKFEAIRNLVDVFLFVLDDDFLEFNILEIIKDLSRDPSWATRKALCFKLSELVILTNEREEIIEIYINLLKDVDQEVTLSALSILNEITSNLSPFTILEKILPVFDYLLLRDNEIINEEIGKKAIHCFNLLRECAQNNLDRSGEYLVSLSQDLLEKSPRCVINFIESLNLLEKREVEIKQIESRVKKVMLEISKSNDWRIRKKIFLCSYSFFVKTNKDNQKISVDMMDLFKRFFLDEINDVRLTTIDTFEKISHEFDPTILDSFCIQLIPEISKNKHYLIRILSIQIILKILKNASKTPRSSFIETLTMLSKDKVKNVRLKLVNALPLFFLTGESPHKQTAKDKQFFGYYSSRDLSDFRQALKEILSRLRRDEEEEIMYKAISFWEKIEKPLLPYTVPGIQITSFQRLPQ